MTITLLGHQIKGFDESVIHLSGGIGQVGDITNYYQKDKSYFDPILWKNNEKTKYEGYCSDVLLMRQLILLTE